jgi:lysozyme
MTDEAFKKVWKEVIKEQIKKHEGYRNDVYIDTVGVPTGGYGHAFHVGSSLPKDIWDEVFEYDFMLAYDFMCDLVHQRELDHIGAVRRGVLVDMAFNLGGTGLLKFKKFLDALRRSDWMEAGKCMEQSKWWGQVGERAVRLRRQIETGEWK